MAVAVAVAVDVDVRWVAHSSHLTLCTPYIVVQLMRKYAGLLIFWRAKILTIN